jgi:hypothetical protein
MAVPDDLDLSPLLLGVGLVVLGLFLNRTAIRDSRLERRFRRAARRADRLFALGDTAAAATLVRREIGRMRRTTAKAGHPLLAETLHLHAQEHHTAGRMRAALAFAEESVATADGYAERDPARAVWPNVTLGRVLSALDDDQAAVSRLRQAYAYVRLDTEGSPEADGRRVIVATNLGMVLRHVGAIEEALQVARWAVTVDAGIDRHALPAFTRAGGAWAHTALALAQADAGQDGREAARQALAAWRELTDTGEFTGNETDGPAYACYAVAYTTRPFDPAEAAAHAQQALTALRHLHARVPGAYAHRLVEVRELAFSLAGA